MTASATPGPSIIFGQRNPPGYGGSNNPDIAPSAVWGGWITVDPRVGYNQTRTGIMGWFGSSNRICLVDAVPAAPSNTNIATGIALAAPGAITLVTTSAAGVNIVASSTTNPLGNGTTVWGNVTSGGVLIPAGTLCLDAVPTYLSAGLAQPNSSSGYTKVTCYNPATMLSRTVTVASTSGADTGVVTLTGWDVYGNPQHEAITISAGSVQAGKKAWKFIASAALSGAGAALNGSIGTGLTTTGAFGIPLFVAEWPYLTVYVGSGGTGTAPTLITSATGWTIADTTSPATATTGDPRGTYAMQTAPASNVRLTMFADIQASQIMSATPTVGLFGVTPF